MRVACSMTGSMTISALTRVGDVAGVVRAADQLAGLRQVGPGRDDDARPQRDAGDPHRPLVLGHHRVGLVVVGQHVDPRPGRHGQERQQLARAGRREQQLLRVRQSRRCRGTPGRCSAPARRPRAAWPRGGSGRRRRSRRRWSRATTGATCRCAGGSSTARLPSSGLSLRTARRSGCVDFASSPAEQSSLPTDLRERAVANKPKAQSTVTAGPRSRPCARSSRPASGARACCSSCSRSWSGLGIVAAAAVPSYLKSRNDPAKKALASFGVAAGAADCSDIETKEGTNTEATRPTSRTARSRSTTRSRRPTARTGARPSSRPGRSTPPGTGRRSSSSCTTSSTATRSSGTTTPSRASSWTRSRTWPRARRTATWPGRATSSSPPPGTTPTATFPSGKHVGCRTGGAQDSGIQLCGQVSGEAVEAFMEKFPCIRRAGAERPVTWSPTGGRGRR